MLFPAAVGFLTGLVVAGGKWVIDQFKPNEEDE